MTIDSIKTVAVLGAGTMGNGIAHVFARAGYDVILRDVEQRFLQRGMETIGKNLDREVKKGKLAEAAKPAVLARLKPLTDMGAIAAADFAVEAVPEKIEIKRAVLTEADRLLRAGSDSGQQHVFDFRDYVGSDDQAAGAVCRDAFHEPGAGDGAGGSDSRAADGRRGVCDDHGTGEEAGQDAGGRE